MVFIPLLGLLAAGETGTGTPAAVGQPGVDACTQALAEPVLASFWPRHINVLRARAVHYIEIGNHEAALGDLEAMHGVAAGQTASPLVDRSVGVSAQLLEAALRARNGDIARAQALAIAAADARPYSLAVQRLAASFFANDAIVGANETRLLQRTVSYDPTLALTLTFRLDRADDAQAAADAWEIALAAGDHMTVRGLDERLGRGETETPDGYTLLRAALAMVRAGRLVRGEQLRAEADAKLGPEGAVVAGASEDSLAAAAPASPAPSVDQTLADARRQQLQAQVDAVTNTSAAPYRPLLRASLAAAHGDNAGALALMQANFDKLPKVMASAELLRRLSETPGIGGQVPTFLVQSAVTSTRPDPAQRYRELDFQDWMRALPQFERVDAGSRYRPGNSVGYRETAPKPDQARIVYAGATNYAGGEMMMLRAAQLAQEHNTDSFVILNIDRALLHVAFVNAETPAPEYASRASRFIRAADVIANLGPIYIDIPAQMEAARRGR
jgi:hypothetical protein